MHRIYRSMHESASVFKEAKGWMPVGSMFFLYSSHR